MTLPKYIRGNTYEELALEKIREINFSYLSGDKYVKDALKDAFTTLEELYMGE